MTTVTADLHIHSVLSPCGDLAMSPSAIVDRAAAIGLDVVGLSDHNSARNTPALAEAARRRGLRALFGLEVRSMEEVDVLTVFDDLDAALDFDAWVYESLPPVPCDARRFGEQILVDADENILGFEPHLLITGIEHSLNEIADEAIQRGGLVIPAHVNRDVDSVISQLGFLPADLAVDAVELNRFGDETVLIGEHPWLGKVPVVRFSDAHLIEDVGYQQTRFHIAEVTVAELRLALAGTEGRWAEPVRQALRSPR
jgi:PHP family Zn ribbon phosphoesterase